jgi:GH18 family chitinase
MRQASLSKASVSTTRPMDSCTCIANEGYFSFRQIKEKLLNQLGFQFFWDKGVEEPLLINPTTMQVLSFDNECSLALKAGLLQKEKMGGIMIWELAADDGKNSLLRTIHQVFLGRTARQVCRPRDGREER